MMNKLGCNIRLFSFGGIAYGIIELLWRRYTHWSMVVTGGTCFTVLYNIFKCMNKIKMWKKCIIGSTVITSAELVAGYAVNIKAGLNVWDYSDKPLNFKGQICLYYSILWALLTYLCTSGR